MNIIIDDQPKRFYLAFNSRWIPAVGHEIRIGKYRFCVIIIKKTVNISEITSGTKVLEIPLNFAIFLRTETKEDALQFYKEVSERLLKLVIQNSAVLDERIKTIRQEAVSRLGEIPIVEIINIDWLEADICTLRT